MPTQPRLSKRDGIRTGQIVQHQLRTVIAQGTSAIPVLARDLLAGSSNDKFKLDLTSRALQLPDEMVITPECFFG
jgi:hypothetical protein